MSELRKCERIVLEKKKRLELIQTFKSKSESLDHAELKAKVCEYFQGTQGVHVDVEVPVENIGIADVVVCYESVQFAFECGDCTPEKIEALKQVFDEVIHIPYMLTPRFINVNLQEISRLLFVHAVNHRLSAEGIKMETGKPICLENCPDCSEERRNDFWRKAVDNVCKNGEGE